MTSAEHQLTPEELVAYLDGEVPSERAALIQAHVADCAVCQRITGELKEASNEMARWQVEEPPRSLRATVPLDHRVSARWFGRAGWRRPAVVWQFSGAAAAAIVVVVLVAWLQPVARRLPTPGVRVAQARADTSIPEAVRVEPVAGPTRVTAAGRPAQSAAEQSADRASVNQPAEGPMIARWATLKIVARKFDEVRPSVDRILREVRGFAGRIDASAARGSSRSLTATLRVPAASLDAALGSLKQLGQVVAESQGGDDVTEQVVDLAARLANARNTEKRLTDVLQHRTGRVADVLEAEREIARVRGEIEHLDAGRKNLDRRVTYATLTLEISEEHKAALDLGPLPVSARFRNAIVDGFRSAFEGALELALALLRVGPSLALWGIVLAWPARILWRRRIRSSMPSA